VQPPNGVTVAPAALTERLKVPVSPVLFAETTTTKFPAMRFVVIEESKPQELLLPLA
jgi:hypothetical protein